MNFISGVQDTALSMALNTVPGLSKVTYVALTTAVPTVKPIGFIIDKLLDDTSKKKIVDEIIMKNSALSALSSKYDLFLLLCKNDNFDITKEVEPYKSTIQPIFDMAEVKVDLSKPLQPNDIELIKKQLNEGFGKVIEHMKTMDVNTLIEPIVNTMKNFNVDDLKKMIKGGTRRRHRRSFRRNKRSIRRRRRYVIL